MSSTLKNLLTVIILGDSGVGKTSLLNQYAGHKINGQHRLDDFVAKEVTVDDCPATMQIWDTAGQERFKSLGAAFYRGCDCCILCFDVNNAKSFEHLEQWREQSIPCASDSNHLPFVVVGNKTDLGQRAVSTTQAQSWCANFDIPYLETSAKEFIHVDQVFQQAARLALQQKSTQAPKFTENFQDLDAIYVLAGTVQTTPTGEIVAGNFDTPDHHGLPADFETRSQAASLIWSHNPSIRVISSGAVLNFGPGLKSKALFSQINKNQLIRDGIPTDSILESSKPVDTLTELISVITFSVEYNWKKILVIGCQAQMERIQLLWEILQNYPLNQNLHPNFAMSVNFFTNRLLYKREQLLTPPFLATLSNFKLNQTQVDFLSSREILEHFDPSKKPYFVSVYSSELMAKRLSSEQRGIEAILNGTYYRPS